MIDAIQIQFKKAPVTVSLVGISLAMFVVEVIMGHGQTANGQLLVTLGAKWGPAIAIDHQYWRLLTPIFLHAGWLHIITNMLTLWFIGPLAEAVFGHRKFL
ncbi:rhomboid family intramembrane serine protease, partial [uncultured Leuconostoc sp.]|uniref:rhomboid family intramembrane serine protease n=1 Tax=uncultured Leuconostoc sp. TaxID=173262 RepID=UPI002592465B